MTWGWEYTDITDRAQNGAESSFGKWDIVSIFILAFLAFTIFARNVLEGSYPISYWREMGTQFFLYELFLKNSLLQGKIPLWTPHIFCGMPLLAYSHTSVLYPFQVIFMLGSFAPAFLYNAMLHLCIYGVGSYLLFRGLNFVRPVSALLAGVLIVSGYYSSDINFLPTVRTLAWTPGIMFLLVMMRRRVSILSLLLLVLLFSLSTLGGDVESLTYFVIFCALALFLRVMGPQDRKTALLLLAFILALMALITAAQLIPLTEFSAFGVRKYGITYHYFSRDRNLIKIAGVMANMLVPQRIIRGGNGLTGYVGFAVFMFGLFGIGRVRQERAVRGWIGLLIFSVIYCAIAVPPLGWIIYRIPLINLLKESTRMYFLFQFSWVVLAGYGLRYLKEPQGLRVLKVVIFGCALQAIIRMVAHPGPELVPLILAPAIFYFHGGGFLKDWRVASGVVAALLVFDILPVTYSKIPRNPRDFLLPEPSYAKLVENNNKLERTVNIGIVFGHEKMPINRQAGFLYGTQSIDGFTSVPIYRIDRFMALLDSRACTFQELKLDSEGGGWVFKEGAFLNLKNMPLLNLINLRSVACIRCNTKITSPFKLNPSSNMEQVYILDGVKLMVKTSFNAASPEKKLVSDASVHGHFTLKFAQSNGGGSTITLFDRDQALGSEETEVDIEAINRKSGAFIFSANSPKGYKSTWERAEIYNPAKPFQRVYADDFEFYRSKSALPRAFLLHSVILAPNLDRALEIISDNNQFQPARELVLESEFVRAYSDSLPQLPEISGNTGADDAVEISDYEPEKIIFKVKTFAPGYLFISDAYYPGWRAWEGKREIPILPADAAFRAIPIEQGFHNIEMIYFPISFRLGLWVSLVSSAMLVIVALWYHLQGIRRQASGIRSKTIAPIT